MSRWKGADKHLRDARGVLVMQWGELNLEAIRRAAGASDVRDIFEELLEAARREVEG
ncbi:MAG: hypothetical protein Kow0063_35300 [Anaerolineae bacterium]